MLCSIRRYSVWFLYYAAVLWIGGFALTVAGCDTSTEIISLTPQEPLEQTPYIEAVEWQYEAMAFLDKYVEEGIERLGKRPNRAELRHLLVRANAEWMDHNGYEIEQITEVTEKFTAHLTEVEMIIDRGQVLSVIMNKQGFNREQRRLVENLITSAEEATTYITFRTSLREVVNDARRVLSEKRAAPILALGARMEGIGWFLHGKDTGVFDNEGSIARAALGAKVAYNPKCARSPKPWYQHFKWRNLVKDIVAGGAYGCAAGGAFTAWIGLSGPGCTIGATVGGGLWSYFYYKEISDAARETLREWCDDCYLDPSAPRNDVGECRRVFGSGEYPPPLPWHHR
jgi:hypothetical protein